MVDPRSLARCATVTIWLSMLACAGRTTPAVRDEDAALQASTGTDARASAAGAGAPRDNAQLWAFAPKSATLGFVASGAGVDTLQGLLIEGIRLLGERPGGRRVLGMAHQWLVDAPFDVLSPNAWSQLGIDGSAGAAVFVLGADDAHTHMLLIFRARDLDAFRRATKVTTTTLQGRTVERGDRVICMPIRGWHACADELDLLLAIERGDTGPMADYQGQIPRHGRGDIEIIADFSHDASFMDNPRTRPFFKPSGKVVMSMRAHQGSARLWLWIEAAIENPMWRAMADISVNSTAGVWQGADDFIRLHLPMAALLQAAGTPATWKLGNGADLRGDLLDNMTGEIIGYSAGGNIFEYRIAMPLNRPEAGRNAVVGVCQDIDSSVATLPGVQPLQITQSGCSTVLDLETSWLGLDIFEQLAAERSRVAISLWVDDEGMLRLDIDSSAEPRRKHNLATDGARELTQGPWHVAVWGLHFDPYAVVPQPLVAFLDEKRGRLDAQQSQEFDVLRWLLGHVAELGAGLAVRDDGVHFVLHLGTFAEDSKAAYRAYEQALVQLLEGDVRGYREAMARLSNEHSLSRAGHHGRVMLGEVSLIGQLDTFYLYLAIMESLGAQPPGEP